jgi:hypothetical protein
VAIPPRAQIARQIDRFAIRIRLAVEIGQERARRVLAALPFSPLNTMPLIG